MTGEHEQFHYVATRLVQRGKRPNGEFWESDVTLLKRADGKLDVEYSGRSITVEGDEVQSWLDRAGLDENLKPVDSN